MSNVTATIERLKQSRPAQLLCDLLPDMVVAVGFLALMSMAFAGSWVSEDAYITFRVLDNFHLGYGLRWNIHERVQAYTHPLWLLLHIPLHAIWDNLFYITIALSMACTAAALLTVLSTVRKPTAITVVCFFIPLAYSKAFMDYTSSGLENPLSYLLYAWFGFVLLRQWDSRRFWFWCSLAVALSLLNRLDTVVIYLPTLVWLALYRDDIRWRQVLAGATPLLAWLLFSLVYYGFLFPNTKYAKLNTELRFIRYIYFSLHYLKYFVVMDTLSAFILFVTPLAWLFWAWRADKRGRLTRNIMLAASLAAGIYSYCLYVVYIGGDYMIGRFWALPTFAAIWLCYTMTPDHIRRDWLFAFACMMLISNLVPPVMNEIRSNCHTCVIGKQRMIDGIFTFRGNKLVMELYPLRMRSEGWYSFGNEGKRIAMSHDTRARTMHYVGMSGFYAGPQAPLVDELALADPLLARLPASKRQSFFAGHFRRDIPKGYLYAIDTGSTERMDPDLAKYYEKLHLITSGDLFDPERLKTILYFNLGMYDHWKQDYVNNNR